MGQGLNGQPPSAMRARRGRKWHEYGGEVLPAWIADLDFPVADAVQDAIERVVRQRDYGYPHRVGDDTVEAAFADRMRDRFGWAPAPGRTRLVADLVQAIVVSLTTFSAPGEGALVQTPIYSPFLESIAATCRRLVASPLRDGGSRFEIDLEGLRSAAPGARVLLLCNPHNPTGRVFDRDQLEAVAAIASEHDLVVVSDEVHADLVHPGSVHTVFASLSEEAAARTVTITSATKSFNIAGLRCGVMHFGSDALWQTFAAAVPERALGQTNVFGLDATIAAWRQGQPWLDQLMPRLTANRDRVADWVGRRWPRIRHHPPEATYLAWLDFAGLGLPGPPEEFFLDQARVALTPGADFGPGYETCARLNFGAAEETLDEILHRMDEALRRRA